MGRFARRLRGLAAALLIALMAAPAAPAAAELSRRVSAPLPAGFVVGAFELSSDGAWLAYQLVEAASPGAGPLIAVPPGGGPAVALSPPGLAVAEFALSPDSTRAVFRDDSGGLSSAPLAGGPATTLAPPEAAVSRFSISSDSQSVVYLGAQGLASVPLGGGPAVALGPPGLAVAEFALSPDGRRVVLRGDAGELLSAPLGGGSATPLSPAASPTGPAIVYRFLISPDSRQVVYLAEQPAPGARELFVTPIDRAAPRRINPPLQAPLGVDFRFALDPAGLRVVYLAAQDEPGSLGVYSAALAGGPPVEVSPPLGAGRSVVGFAISPASDRLAFIADPNRAGVFELFSAPLAGDAAPLRLSPELQDAGDVALGGLAISPSGRVIFRADAVEDGRFALYSAPLAGGAPLTLSADAVFDAAFAPDGETVIYQAAGGASPALLRVHAGGGPSLALSDPPAAGGSVRGFLVGPPGAPLIYRADQARAGQIELFATELGDGLLTPVFGPDVPAVVGEDAGTIAIPVLIGQPRAGPAWLRISASGDLSPGADYELASPDLFFAPGSTVASLVIVLRDNARPDPDRRLTLRLDPVGAPEGSSGLSLSLLVRDDDAAARLRLPLVLR